MGNREGFTGVLRLGTALFCAWIAYKCRQDWLLSIFQTPSDYGAYLEFTILGVFLMGTFIYIEGSTRISFFQKNRYFRAMSHIKAALLVFLLVGLVAFLSSQHLMSRTWLLLWMLLWVILQLGVDYFLIPGSVPKLKIMFVGCGDFAQRVNVYLQAKEHNCLLLEPVSEDDSEAVCQKILRYEPDYVLLGRGGETLYGSVLSAVSDSGLTAKVLQIAWLIEASSEGKRLERMHSWLWQVLGQEDDQSMYRRQKRVLDLGLILIFLPIWGTVCLIVACLLLISNQRPILFKQVRAGELGRLFMIYKFRTMKPATEIQGKPEASHDMRLTPMGWFLRRMSLDEFPQFVNVLLGDMSLVGPRPEMLSVVHSHYRGISFRRMLARPGITGLWQIYGRKQPIHDHLKYDFYYLRHQSFLMDAWILAMTIPALILRRGAR